MCGNNLLLCGHRDFGGSGCQFLPSFTLSMTLFIPGRGRKRWYSIYKKIYKYFTRAAFPADTVKDLVVYLNSTSFSLDLYRNIRWNFWPCFKSLHVISPVHFHNMAVNRNALSRAVHPLRQHTLIPGHPEREQSWAEFFKRPEKTANASCSCF